MSRGSRARVIERRISDGAFRRRLATGPGASGWSGVLAPGDDPMHGAFISGDGAGGATTPPEPMDGPEIQS